MKKPSRKTLNNIKHIAIGTTLIGGTLFLTHKSLKLVNNHYTTKLELDYAMFMLSSIYKADPELVETTVGQAAEDMRKALGAINKAARPATT